MAKKYHSYIFYGLKINSEILLHPLKSLPVNSEYDVLICLGTAERPAPDQEDTIYKPSTVYNKNIFYWNVENIAAYLVSGNNSITIDKVKGSHWQDVRVFLFDTVLSVLLIKHNKFVFHAACVATSKEAYLISSSAGSGKSTLAAILANTGLNLVEDDRCLLEWDERRHAFVIQNQVPIASLWENIKALEKNKKAINIGKIRKKIRKINYDISALVPKRKIVVKKLILINMDNGEDRIEKTDIKGISKINVVKTYTHLQHLINGLGKNKPHFQMIAKISSNIPAVKIERSQLTPIPKFVQFVRDEITP